MEIKMCEIVLAGRIKSDLKVLDNGTVHFLMDCKEDSSPIHCYCQGSTAENLMEFCERRDEISCEGTLDNYYFSGESKSRLIVCVEYISYGRKQRTLR